MLRHSIGAIPALLTAALVQLCPVRPARGENYSWALTRNRLPVSRAQTLGAMPAGAPVRIVVGLGWRHKDQLAQLLREIQAPQSSRYQQYLDPAEFDALFAPTPDEVREVTDYLATKGFTIAHVTADRLLIVAVGTAAGLRDAFATPLVRYRRGAASYYAAASDPVLPGKLGRHVVSIQGLENHLRLRPHLLVAPRAALPQSRGAPYSPQHIARAYNFARLAAAGLRGNNTRAATIAILTAQRFAPEDVAAFWRAFGIDRSAADITVVSIGGEATATNAESTVDVQWAGAMAPEARLIVYEAKDNGLATFLEMYHHAVTDNRAAVITTSWGLCEDLLPARYQEQVHAIFQKAAALGISILAAAGDDGAHCLPGAISVDFPASHPLVTAVGGTSLYTGANGSYRAEKAWSGSGGGSSGIWAQPLWQARPNGRRGLADVALNADPATGYYTYYKGSWWQYGGTSIGAPIWAALLALANQYRAIRGKPTVGVPAPRFCELMARDPTLFRDIRGGHNQAYRATTGWDYLTGWGTPDAARLVAALGDVPPSGDVAGGLRIPVLFPNLAEDRRDATRVTFAARCANSVLEVRLPAAPPGDYELLLDDQLMATFEVKGGASFRVPTVDPRGRMIVLKKRGAAEVISGGRFPAAASTPVAIAERLRSLSRVGGSGSARYRARNGVARFSISVSGLPSGQYDLIVGSAVAGSFTVHAHGGRRRGSARFDTRAGRGALLTFDPRCQRIAVARGPKSYLRIDSFGSRTCPH